MINKKALTSAVAGVNVVSYGYDEATQVLRVVHLPVSGKPSVWDYQNVPRALWDMYQNSHSVWIHNMVVGKFSAVPM